MTNHYVFDMKFQSGPYTIEIDTRAEYGYFEHEDLGDERGGGLWFEDNKLTDYDGMEYLPAYVIKGLREAGFIVDEEFE